MTVPGNGHRGRMTHSLLQRIMAGLLASLVLVFLVQWLAAQVTVSDMMMDFVGHELLDDADELYEYLDLDTSGARPTASIKHEDPAYSKPGSGRYYEILVDGQQALRSPTLGETDLQPPALPVGQATTGRRTGPDGKPMLYGVRSFERAGHTVTVETGVSISPVDEKVDRLLLRLALLSAGMSVMLLGIQYAIVFGQLRVLGRIRREVESVSKGERQRLDEQVPREVLPLVQEINHLSGTLASRLVRSRQALGNLAHALKTPLSRLMQAAHEQDATLPQPSGMQDQLKTLRRRIDLELKRARLAGPSSRNTTFDLSRDIADFADALRKLHAHKTFDLTADMAPAVLVHADREDVLELIGNLLDNACKFAVRHVHVQVRAGDGLHIRVEDDGPGCSEDQIKQMIQRGWRADDSVEGSGLGLAIVADIANSYGASLSFGRSASLGGLQVDLRMPSSLLVRVLHKPVGGR